VSLQTTSTWQIPFDATSADRAKGAFCSWLYGQAFPTDLTHHFVVDFVEMDLADFVDDILALKRDEPKA